MPNPDGTAWLYIPSMVDSISELAYSFQELSAQVTTAERNPMLSRLATLTKPPTLASISAMQNDKTPELFGASATHINLDSKGAQATVKLDGTAKQSLVRSLAASSVSQLPDDVFLMLEGIKGTSDACIYKISINGLFAGHISLFGIRKASKKTGHHAGAGLTVKLNISTLADQLHLNGAIPDSLDVKIEPDGPVMKGGESCTIDRIGVYRRPNN